MPFARLSGYRVASNRNRIVHLASEEMLYV
jgi:hypothetical protein